MYLITFRLRIFEAKMQDRNNDMRMSCTICPCKEYVAEESVKCAFCGHFPILHQIVSPENSSSSTSTSASNMQSYFALLSEPLVILIVVHALLTCQIQHQNPLKELILKNEMKKTRSTSRKSGSTLKNSTIKKMASRTC